MMDPASRDDVLRSRTAEMLHELAMVRLVPDYEVTNSADGEMSAVASAHRAGGMARDTEPGLLHGESHLHDGDRHHEWL